MDHKVFVYGSLMTGRENHDVLAGHAERLAEQAWVDEAKLYSTKNYYPALVKGSETVYGELYTVNNEGLRQLDQLEGYTGNAEQDLYDRIKVTVGTDEGKEQTFTYFLGNNHHSLLKEPVKFNDWKVHHLIDQPELLYFAYGSCMDNERFTQAGVDHLFTECIGCGRLAGYSLKFAMKGAQGNAADIVEDGGVVEGKVYRINQDALEYLLVREGARAGHYRPAVISLEIDHNKVDDVLTFIVLNKHEELKPTNIYATEILRGGKGTLSEAYWKALRTRIKNQFNIEVDV